MRVQTAQCGQGLHRFAGSARHIGAGLAQVVHLVAVGIEELDDGEVLGQAEVPIHPGDDATALAARVLVEEHRLYPQVLTEFVRR